MSNYVIFNGALLPGSTPIAGAGSRGLRYGDGLFETMKIAGGTLLLAPLHFDRLWEGMQLLGFTPGTMITPGFLASEIHRLAAQNNHRDCRVRLMIFRGDGGPSSTGNDVPNYAIETMPLSAGTEFSAVGIAVGLYPDARIAPDRFSHLKSNNYLPYLLGARFATTQGFDDVLLLNTDGMICESSIANCFVITGDRISTPPISSGCVAGVMRRRLLETLPGYGFSVSEQQLSLDDLRTADECFLTNAVSGIRWVRQFEERIFSNDLTRKIYDHLVSSIWPSAVSFQL